MQNRYGLIFAELYIVIKKEVSQVHTQITIKNCFDAEAGIRNEESAFATKPIRDEAQGDDGKEADDATDETHGRGYECGLRLNPLFSRRLIHTVEP